jgi:hypothetical protein
LLPTYRQVVSFMIRLFIYSFDRKRSTRRLFPYLGAAGVFAFRSLRFINYDILEATENDYG